jgi:hypothetical protein
MSVSLMSVKVNNHESLSIVPLAHVVDHKRDIWVDTEAFSICSISMVISSREVDGPFLLKCHIGCHYRAKSGSLHGIENPLSDEKSWKEN